MLTLALTTATEETAHRELPVPAEWFGIGTLVLFCALFAFTWAFRSVASKH